MPIIQKLPYLTWNGARWEFFCRAGRGQIAKDAGFHHDWRANCYWTGLRSSAIILQQYADDRAKAKLNEINQHIDMSKAVDLVSMGIEDIEIPAPKGLSYLPFQRAGIVAMLLKLGFDITKLKKK